MTPIKRGHNRVMAYLIIRNTLSQHSQSYLNLNNHDLRVRNMQIKYALSVFIKKNHDLSVRNTPG